MRHSGLLPWIRVSTAALILTLAFASPAAAMTCAVADPWFLQRISLLNVPELPFGVSLKLIEQTSPSTTAWPFDSASLSRIEVHNDTPTPLYLLKDAEEFQRQMGYEPISWSDDDITGAPTGMKTYSKVQHSVTFGWPYNCAVVRCDHVGWSLNRNPMIVTDGLWGVSRGFEDRVVRKNNRPMGVRVPAEQFGSLTLLYAGRTIAIPFVVTYELNKAYRPDAGAENCGAGLAVVGLVLIVALVGGSVALLIGTVFVIDLAKNRLTDALRRTTRSS